MLSKKIFIAGHKGLVGSAVLRKLKKKKYKKIFLAEKKKLNLLDQKKTIKYLKKIKPDIVIICAAKVGGIKANNNFRADFIYENLQIQNNLIFGSFKAKVKKLIFLGSSCIYPKNMPKPIKEKDILSSPLEKTNEPYAIAKIAGIKMCESFNIQYKTNYISLMPCNVYGPYDNFDLDNSHFIPAILKKIYLNRKKKSKILKLWGTGKAKREVLYVDDLADAIIFFMNKKTKENLINIGSNIEMTIKNFVIEILKILKVKMKIKFNNNKLLDGTLRKKLNINIAKKYGWKSKTNFKKSIITTYNHLVEIENKND